MNIIVTGTSHPDGIGHRLAHKLTGQGHTVIGWTRNANNSSKLKLFLEIETDVASTFQCAYAARESLEYFNSGVDVLVNNAGVNHMDFLTNLQEEDWYDSFNVNVKAAVNTSRSILDELTRSKGTILNICSSAANTPMTASAAYNASKAALQMLTLQMARELGREYGITVFGINPAKVRDTEMSRRVDKRVCEVRGWSRKEAYEYQVKALGPAGEIDPDTFVEFVSYLLKNKTNHKYFAGCMIPYGAQG